MRREYKVAAVCGAILISVLSVGPAQSLASRNTVFTDDITDGNVRAADISTGAVRIAEIAANAVNSPRVVDNSLTGADINESTLALPKVYFIRIDASTGKVAGSANATAVKPQGQGVSGWDVTFTGVNLARCAVTGTAHAHGFVRAYIIGTSTVNAGVYDAMASDFPDYAQSLSVQATCP